MLGVAVRNAEFLRWVINSLPSRLVSTRRNVRLGHGERGAAEPPRPRACAKPSERHISSGCLFEINGKFGFPPAFPRLHLCLRKAAPSWRGAGAERSFPYDYGCVFFFFGGGRRRLFELFHNVERISCGLRPSQPLLTQTFSPCLALDACPG